MSRPALTLLLLTLPVSARAAGNVEFVLPATPLPWTLLTFVTAALFLAAGALVLVLRFVFGDRRVRLRDESRQQLEKAYADRLRDEYQKKNEELKTRLQQVRRQASMLFAKVKNLTTTLDPSKVFDAITEMLVQEVGVARYILFLHDRGRNELYPFRWAGYKDEIRELLTLPADRQEHFVTWAFGRRQLVYRTAALDDPETRGLVDRNPLPDTIIALPINVPGESFGVVHIESFEDGRQEVDEADLRFMSSLGSFMGMALANANVFLQTRAELTSTKQLSEREIAEKRKLKEMFSKYTSSELVDTLLANPGSLHLGGIEKNATILFSDIAGFTAFSAGLTPAQVVASMNEYLSAMTDVVLEHNGEIDKFIGDAVMARFGVLGDLPSSGLAAIHAAQGMLDRLRLLQARWAQQGRECFKIRIGIATGPVLAGNIGSERRQEFTVMGSTVNLASRLEALNKEFKTTVLVDENTFAQVAKEVRAIPHENVQIRGLEGRLRVYEIQGLIQAGKPAIPGTVSMRDRLAPTPAEPASAPQEAPPETGGTDEPSRPADPV
ncbi:MAG TPA: adenylate/guanylate cyclase domain-containing protein [Candidatus Ozemobacteraceae bacterium]|nr:adenylate/guanylate cyclase domain-containing protein [Candidatus Ozemobacteraceae bacterium]